jgi:hypothetical protein
MQVAEPINSRLCRCQMADCPIAHIVANRNVGISMSNFAVFIVDVRIIALLGPPSQMDSKETTQQGFYCANTIAKAKLSPGRTETSKNFDFDIPF